VFEEALGKNSAMLGGLKWVKKGVEDERVVVREEDIMKNNLRIRELAEKVEVVLKEMERMSKIDLSQS
jgi:hypothetical protein